MNKDLFDNAVKLIRERFKNADTVEMIEGAERYGNRIKKQLIEAGFTPKEAQSAFLQGKYYSGGND